MNQVLVKSDKITTSKQKSSKLDDEISRRVKELQDYKQEK